MRELEQVSITLILSAVEFFSKEMTSTVKIYKLLNYTGEGMWVNHTVLYFDYDIQIIITSHLFIKMSSLLVNIEKDLYEDCYSVLKIYSI